MNVIAKPWTINTSFTVLLWVWKPNVQSQDISRINTYRWRRPVNRWKLIFVSESVWLENNLWNCFQHNVIFGLASKSTIGRACFVFRWRPCDDNWKHSINCTQNSSGVRSKLLSGLKSISCLHIRRRCSRRSCHSVCTLWGTGRNLIWNIW